MKISNYSVRVLNAKGHPTTESASGHVPLGHGETYTLLLRNSSNQDAIAAIKIDGKNVAHIKVPANDKVKLDAPIDSDKKFTFYKANSEEGDDLELDKVSKNELGLIEVQFVAVDNTVTYTTTYSGTNIIYVPYRQYWPYWTGPYWYNTTVTTATPNYTLTTTGGSGSGGYTINNCTLDSSVTLTSSTNTAFVANYNTSTHKNFNAGGTGLSGMAEHEPKNVEQSKKEFKKHYDEDSLTTIYLRLVEGSELKEKPAKLRGYSNPIPDPV